MLVLDYEILSKTCMIFYRVSDKERGYDSACIHMRSLPKVRHHKLAVCYVILLNYCYLYVFPLNCHCVGLYIHKYYIKSVVQTGV